MRGIYAFACRNKLDGLIDLFLHHGARTDVKTNGCDFIKGGLLPLNVALNNEFYSIHLSLNNEFYSIHLSTLDNNKIEVLQ